MKTLSNKDIEEFQIAFLEDYGVRLEGSELYQAAFKLLQFFETLIKYNQLDKQSQVEARGSIAIQDNPLNSDNDLNTME